MFIAIDFLRVSDGINIEIYLAFLLSRFPLWTKKSGQNLNTLRNKRVFKMK